MRAVILDPNERSFLLCKDVVAQVCCMTAHNGTWNVRRNMTSIRYVGLFYTMKHHVSSGLTSQLNSASKQSPCLIFHQCLQAQLI